MVIEFKVKSVYGNELIYPVSREAILFAELTGKKTLNETDLNKIKAIGFEVVVN